MTRDIYYCLCDFEKVLLLYLTGIISQINMYLHIIPTLHLKEASDTGPSILLTVDDSLKNVS